MKSNLSSNHTLLNDEPLVVIQKNKLEVWNVLGKFSKIQIFQTYSERLA